MIAVWQEGSLVQVRHHKMDSSTTGGEPGQYIRIPVSRWSSTDVSRIHADDSGLKLFNTSLVLLPVKAMYKCMKSICLTVSPARIDVMNR